MKDEHRNLLLRCLELTEKLVGQEPPEWHWDRREWDEQRDHGPRYACGRWFGPLRERDRVRYRRAIDNLEEQGLVETWRCWGDRLTHVKLTDAGGLRADQLRREAVTDG